MEQHLLAAKMYNGKKKKEKKKEVKEGKYHIGSSMGTKLQKLI
jgi:hypothetical protein